MGVTLTSRRINAALALGLVALVFAALAVPAAPAAPASPATSKTIVQVAAGNPEFSTLASLIKKAGLVSALSGKSKLTVFAPTNAAFAKLPKATLKKVQSDKKLLTSILTYHVVKGAVPASKVVQLNGKSVKTLNGKSVKIAVKSGKVYVNKAKVTKTDVKASNGVIHVINQVLIP
jgi:uncharacterized surface protein with fasciclin (FAS1) repeats